MNLDLTLVFANAIAACYVKSGTSPGLNDVVTFLENYSSVKTIW
jgi:hypothetical protein